MEGSITQPVVEHSSVVLAAERTRRKDPLDGFKRYTGGWNISEHHYWAVSTSNNKHHFKKCDVVFARGGIFLFFIFFVVL